MIIDNDHMIVICFITRKINKCVIINEDMVEKCLNEETRKIKKLRIFLLNTNYARQTV